MIKIILFICLMLFSICGSAHCLCEADRVDVIADAKESNHVFFAKVTKLTAEGAELFVEKNLRGEAPQTVFIPKPQHDCGYQPQDFVEGKKYYVMVGFVRKENGKDVAYPGNCPGPLMEGENKKLEQTLLKVDFTKQERVPRKRSARKGLDVLPYTKSK